MIFKKRYEVEIVLHGTNKTPSSCAYTFQINFILYEPWEKSAHIVSNLYWQSA